MKLKYNKLLVSVVIVTFVTFGLLLAECFGKSIDYQEKSIFPSFVSQGFFETRTNNEEYIIEKIAQTQENGVDMRSTLHFTQHGYLLNNISNLKIKFRQKTYTLNDVCFKPHITIFQQSSSSDQNEYPHYIQRLLLEMQRLSPCLIVTPLNCFYDIYRIHGEISNWNKNTDFLNRRLRNSYIEAIGENDERPYVKSNYGPSLIKSWADHMFDLPSKSFTNSTKDALFQKIKLWLLSIEPRQKTCAASIHSCDTPLDSEHYFNICTDMQSVDNFAEKKTKFKLEDVDEEFAMNLDCVDDQEQFIEWMQELEIRKMYSHVTEKPDYPNVVNQTCDKIFHDLNSTGIEFFDGSRSFSSTKSQFDTMQTEIVLLTPEMLLSAMQHSDFVNGFESIWTIEKAEELIHEFRLALKEETEKFKENRMSKMIRVTSRVLDNTVTTKLQSFSEKQTIHFVVNVHSLIVILFTIFVWSGVPLRSAFMFFVRDALTCLLFCFVCSTDGVIVLDTELIKYIIVLTLANLYFTTRSSFCTERLSRCIQREKRFPINSNFASLITVDTMTDSRQIQYFLSTVTKYQAAQDSYSNELFERFPKNWGCTSILIFPIVFVYWYFIDSNFDKICVSVLPSFCLAAGEELFAKNMFWKEREAMQAKQRLENEEQAESITGSSLEKLFAGNKPVSNTDKANIVKKSSIIRNQKPCLQDLSPGTYDVSNFMKYPHQASRIFREKIIGLYLRILKLRTLGVILCIPAILLIVISIGLLFIPVKRETLHTDSKQDDIFIEFEIFNFSTNWKIVNQNLKQFSEDIESIGTLYTISNWQKSFERFEQETNKNASAEWNILFKWINDEPINSAVTLFSEKSSGNQTIANPFKFRLRYGFDAKNETTVIEIVQKIDELLSKCSKNLSPKAVGVLYEHYHRIAVVWNLFAFNQLTTAGIFIILLSIITFIFAITPTIKATFLFSLLVVGTQIEVAALVHLFSLDHHQIYTNLALFAGFLAAWDPFCALLRYRRRILYKSETRRTPELASKRRVLLPIVATADIAQFFVLLITAFSILAIICSIVPELNIFFVPTVILIVIQIVAVFNSIIVSIATKQMFESEVRHYLHRDLRGSTTAVRVYNLVQKQRLASSLDEPQVELDEFSIKRSSPPCRYYAPPPKYSCKKRSRSSDEDEDSDPNQPGPSNRRSPKTGNKRVRGNGDNTELYIPNRYELIVSGKSVGGNTSAAWNGPGSTLEQNMNALEECFELGVDEYDFDEHDGDEGCELVQDMLDRERNLMNKRSTAQRRESRNIEKMKKSQENLDKEKSEEKISESKKNQDDSIESPNLPGTPANLPVDEPLPPVGRLYIVEHVLPEEYRRDPLTEPPSMEDCIRAHSDPNLPPHPRADQYPASFTRPMVEYCEDIYWTHRTGQLPPGLQVPRRPYDYYHITERTPPPEDLNWVPPAESPPIPIPQQAFDLLEERRRNHREQQDEAREGDLSDPEV